MTDKEEQYRILTPSDYWALKDAILHNSRASKEEKHEIVVDLLLFTGMRYTELQVFAGNLSWFDARNRAISLPGRATKTREPRVIHLTPAFTKILETWIRRNKPIEVPHPVAMARNLKRWCNSGYTKYLFGWNPSPKTFRKTWESWLLAAGYTSMAVALSQGHSELISYGHYANLDPRLKSEMDEVRELTKGWGM